MRGLGAKVAQRLRCQGVVGGDAEPSGHPGEGRCCWPALAGVGGGGREGSGGFAARAGVWEGARWPGEARDGFVGAARLVEWATLAVLKFSSVWKNAVTGLSSG
jgi:hypothetical protein